MVPRVPKVNPARKVQREKMVKTGLKGHRVHKVNLGHRVPQDKMEHKAHKAQLVKTEFRAPKALLELTGILR